MVARISSDSRNLVSFAVGTMSLVILLTVVAWAASSGKPAAELTARTKQAELLSARPGPDRSAPATDVAGGARDATATTSGQGEGEAAAADDAVAADASDSRIGGVRTFVVGTRPRGAFVSLDGEPLSDASPVTIEVDIDTPHTLRIELDGYEPLTWGFSRDGLSPRHLESGELYFPLRELPPDETEEEAPEPSEPAAETIEESPPPAADPAVTSNASGYGVAGPPPSPADVRRVRAHATTRLAKEKHAQDTLLRRFTERTHRSGSHVGRVGASAS